MVRSLPFRLLKRSEHPEGVYLQQVRYKSCISLLQNHCQDPLLIMSMLKGGDLF